MTVESFAFLKVEILVPQLAFSPDCNCHLSTALFPSTRMASFGFPRSMKAHYCASTPRPANSRPTRFRRFRRMNTKPRMR